MTELHPVINQFELPRLDRIQSLGSAGGFSGAQLWRLSGATEFPLAAAPQPVFCLRKWPTSHPSFEHLQWIHLVVSHAKTAGCQFVAAPILSRTGPTIIRHLDALWEISPWMPGAADFHRDSNDNRLRNMIQALARFHLATAQVSLDFRSSAGVKARISQLEQLESRLDRIRNASTEPPFAEIESLRWMILDRAPSVAPWLANQLRVFENVVLPVQPVIRDVWHDHLLFSDDEVTGLIDFGAMQMDHVALDISRLLGSTIGDDRERWESAIQSYTELRPLSPEEVDLMPLLDKTATVLGSVNWLSWIYVERRQFDQPSQVLKRVNYLAQRMANVNSAT